MSMLIDSCNDIQKYEESVVAGLNWKKTVYAGIAVVVGGVLALLLVVFFHIPIIFGVYGATPLSGLIIVIGFYEKDGMTFMQIMKKKLCRSQSGPVLYSSTETAFEYEIKAKQTVTVVEDPDEEFERVKRMILRGAIIAALILISVIVLLVVLL